MISHTANGSTIDLVTATWTEPGGVTTGTFVLGLLWIVVMGIAIASFSSRSYGWGTIMTAMSVLAVVAGGVSVTPHQVEKSYVEITGTVKSVTRIPAGSIFGADGYGLRLAEHQDLMLRLDRDDATGFLGNDGSPATVYCDTDDRSETPATLDCYASTGDAGNGFDLSARFGQSMDVPKDAHITRKPYTLTGGER